MKRSYLFSLLAVFCIIFPISLKAIDGYFMLGYGTVSKGMAGTGVAYYRTSIIGNNPAGRVFLGNQYSVSANLLFPSTTYTISGTPSGIQGTIPFGTGSVDSDTKVLFVPNLGANWQISEKSAFGISLYGCGIATDYPMQTFFVPNISDPNIKNTGVNFQQMFLDPTYSLKIGDKHAIGLSAMIMYQRFKAEGLSTFGNLGLSTNPSKLSNNGFDSSFGFGFKIGYLGEIIDGLHVGATYQSKTSASEFKEYEGLFAEKGDFDAPANWTIGAMYELTDDFKLLVDIQQIYFSDIKSLGNDITPLLVTAASFDPNQGYTNTNGLLGKNTGAGFGWEDMTIVKIGVEYKTGETLTLRGGYAFGEEPIRESEVLFNILAPVVNNQHITLGATQTFGGEGKTKDLNLALVYAPKNSVKGPSPLDPAQNVELELGVFELELSLTF